MTVVLHTCCGPCASACVPRLKEAGLEVTMLFANSNIDTEEEFLKRRGGAEKLATVDGVGFAALPYDHAEWLREVAAGYENEPEKGRRCERCFRYNLRKTAEYAAAHGLEAFTTSLTVSPHKVSSMIFAAAGAMSPGQRASCPLHSVTGATGVSPVATSNRQPVFLPEDFKKKEGFKLSVRRAAELGLYRQAYCGCEFSKRS